jgi:hypothetical protein
MYNKQRRKQWQNSHLSSMMQNLKSRILSTNTVSPLPGWKQRTITLICLKELGLVQEMAAQRIPGSGTAVTSSINMLAPSWGLATSHPSQATSFKRQASSDKLQASSFKLQVSKFFVNRFKRQATSFKPQATSGKLQAARAFIKFFISVRVAGN